MLAIIVFKMLFGGIGKNFLNPALAARLVLRILFTAEMVKIVLPQTAVSAISTATPLELLKNGQMLSGGMLFNDFIGNIGGKLGETSSLFLLAGAAYLLVRGVIRFRIPGTMLACIAFMAFMFGGQNGLFSADISIVLGHVLSAVRYWGFFHGYRLCQFTLYQSRTICIWRWMRRNNDVVPPVGPYAGGSELCHYHNEFYRTHDRPVDTPPRLWGKTAVIRCKSRGDKRAHTDIGYIKHAPYNIIECIDNSLYCIYNTVCFRYNSVNDARIAV